MIYDTVIVGAGAAGVTLATRLTEDPSHHVLLLESGPDYPDFATLPDVLKYGDARTFALADDPHNWNYSARGTDLAKPIEVPRGKAMGGSTAINAQIFLRGVPEDYDSWADEGLDEWSYKKLLAGFRRSENDLDYGGDFHGKDGPISIKRPAREEWLPAQVGFYKACRALGYADCPDHNLPDSTGVGPLSFNTIDGVRISTALDYLPEARHRLNLTIRPETLVHRIVIENGQAVGVIAESGGGNVRGERRAGDRVRGSCGVSTAANAFRHWTG